MATTAAAGRHDRALAASWAHAEDRAGAYSALRAQAEAFPDATLAAQCERWFAATGVRVSQATMSRLFAKRGITHKKRP